MAGTNIRWFDTVASTNLELALADASSGPSGLPEGTVFAALSQTSGRGQKGNVWLSEKGENLTFSVLLRPESLPANNQAAICQAAAIAVSDYLLEKGIETRIKWPNDIYAGDSKICGMLIENTLMGAFIGRSIVGIGLNVNQTAFDPSLPNPTSMKLLTARDFDLKIELESLLRHFSEKYAGISSFHGRNYVESDYACRLYRRGEWHGFELLPESDVPADCRTGKRVKARILGTDASFKLILELEDGTIGAFPFKALKYLI